MRFRLYFLILIILMSLGVQALGDITVPEAHPRIWWTAARITQAQTWFASNPFTPDGPEENAFKYILTGNTAYSDSAITSLMAFTVPQGELDGVSSDTYRWAGWVPVVFDWCYYKMTQEQRDTFIARYDSYVEILRNKSWGGPGKEANNYYWGYLRNEFNWAVATYHESENAATFLNHALVTRWENSFLPYALAAGQGGVPHEGSAYGRYMLRYPVLPWETAGLLGRDILDESNFYKEAIFYVIYTTTPAQTLLKGAENPYFQTYPFNDDGFYLGYPSALSEDYGNFMTMVANEWSTLDIGKYARQWLNAVEPDVSKYVQSTDSGGSALAFTSLPLDYYSPGISHFFGRSAWGAGATTIQLQLNRATGVGHQHEDWGSFQIWRSGKWLSKESTGYGMTITGGTAAGTIAHNTIMMGDDGFCYGDTNGPPIISRLESREDYFYGAVDLSDMYRNDEVPWSKPWRENANVDTVIREFVFIRPLETLVILDRLKSTSEVEPAADVEKTFLIRFPLNPTIQDSNNVLATNDDHELRLTTLLPASPSYEVIDEDASEPEESYTQYRLEVSTSGAAESYFIHVLQSRASSGSNIVSDLTVGDNTFTIDLEHATLGYASIIFNKGMTSSGGSVGYLLSGAPSVLRPFIGQVQDLEVTDSGPVWAESGYYVDPLGSDSDPGSQSEPWLTIQHAADTVEAGATVYVNDGTYVGFHSVRSGDVSNPITFRANGTNVIINSANEDTDDNVNIEGHDYIVVDGFVSRDSLRAGIRVVTSTGVVIKNCTLIDNFRWGILTGFATQVQVLDNIAYGTEDEHGIYVANSNTVDDNFIVRGNVSYSNYECGIQFNGDHHQGGDGMLEGGLIENNLIYDNGLKGLNLTSISDSVIRNNILIDNGTRAGAGGIHLVDEPSTSKYSCDNVLVNNTVLESNIMAIRMNPGSTDNIIFNNIFTGRASPIADDDGGNYISSNITQVTNADLFVDDVGGDYRLVENSPALDAGVASYQSVDAPGIDFDGATRPQDSGYDAGAWEGIVYYILYDPFFWIEQSNSESYGGSGSWNDISGYGNHCVQATGGEQPTITGADGLSGTSRLFDGTNDSMSAGDTLDEGVGDFTIIMWVKRDGQPAALEGLLTKRSTVGYGLYINTAGRIQSVIQDSGGSVTSTNDGTDITDDAWHLAAATYDRDGDMTRYVDGWADGTADNISAISGSVANAEDFVIGDDSSGSSYYFQGYIASGRKFARSFTAAEIQRAYLAEKPRYGGL